MSLARQTSHASADFSSVASDSRSDSGVIVKKQRDDAAEAGLEETRTVEKTVFAVVYTILKESYETSWKFSTAALVVDFVQLLMILLKPEYGWDLNTHIWIWKAARAVGITFPVVARGYSFYSFIFYVFLMATAITLSICFWIAWAFRMDRLNAKWPVKIARFFVTMCSTVFYVGLLDFMFVSLDCHPFNQNKDLRWHLGEFPSKGCMDMPQPVQTGVAVLQLAVITFLTFIMGTAGAATNPLTTRKLASQHSVIALRCIYARTLIVAASRLATDYKKVQSGLFVFFYGYMLWCVVVWAPYLDPIFNYIKVAGRAGLAWVALILAIMRHVGHHQNDRDWAASMTKAAIGGMFPVMLLFVGISHAWLKYRTHRIIKAFRQPNTGKKLKDIYRFSDEYEVEVATRCCRKWVEDDVLDPDAVQLAESIIRAGMARFPGNAFLTILYANLLIDVMQSNQSGQSQLDAARKLSAGGSLTLRYIMFVREQERSSRTKSSGSSSIDLSSYVEFQHVFRQVLYSHKTAVHATKTFWKMLLHHDVKFVSVMRAFEEIEACEAKAERTYRTMIERYPTSAKLLRCYSRYLEDVKNDPWGAAKYLSEAEKLDDDAEMAETTESAHAHFDDANDAKAEGGSVADHSQAIMLINAAGLIRMVNKKSAEMFGYKKGELEGKNVSVIMPPPFSQRHNIYLRNYVQTGKSNVVDQTRHVLGMQKTGAMIPLKIHVRIASGTGADAMFLGILEEEKGDPATVRCWMLHDGLVMSVDQRFTDWFGKSRHDCLGKSFASLGVDPEKTSQVIEMAQSVTALTSGKSKMTNVALLHKYLDPVAVDIKVKLIGTENERILLLEMTRAEGVEEQHVLITDDKLAIIYAAPSTAKLLGYQPDQMAGKLGISDLMNPPFSLLHEQWVQDMPTKVPQNSCRNGVTVVAVTSNGSSLPVRLKIEPRVIGDKTMYTVNIHKSNFEEGLNNRRLTLKISDEGVVQEVNTAPYALFGFKAGDVVGKHVSELIDILEELVSIECMPITTILKAMAVK